MKMTVSEYIVSFLESQRVEEVFLITGGAVAFIVDAFSSKKNIKYICMQHEQSAAMAADAYARLGPGGLGVAMATSGPGATNLITGICCAWYDSIPVLYITGQVNTKEQSGGRKVRQIGFQETNIVDIVKPITKLAEKLEKAEDIKYLLEKAVSIAKSQRPGPVLVDIPINLQYQEINPEQLIGYKIPKENSKQDLNSKISQTINLIEKSKRPVLLLGFGIRLAGAEKEIESLLSVLKLPIVTTWSGLDLVPFNHPMRVGQSGIYGSRAANFAVQNSDLLISVGARLETRQTGGDPKTYAREAKKVVIDIDPAELDKKRGLTPDVAIATGAKEFINAFLKRKEGIKFPDITGWLNKVDKWKKKYPVLKQEYLAQKKYVNPYVFCKILSDLLPSNAVIIPDEGGNLTWTIQGIQLKKGQRLFSAFGNSPMGYALPASIGACFATQKKKPIICITGDGGLQINIQELQTIVHHKLPIKIFVLDNKCYGIIKQFQDTWLGSRYEASDLGYSTPDFLKVAKAYGLKAIKIDNHSHLKKKIKEVLAGKDSIFCDVLLDPGQKILPKTEFGMPLEDMMPYLQRKEFFKNMIIAPLQKSKDLK